MKKDKFTIQEITESMQTYERATRDMLHDAGVQVDTLTKNPNEEITRAQVLELMVYIAGTPAARRLRRMLK